MSRRVRRARAKGSAEAVGWTIAWVLCLVLAIDFVGIASGRPSILHVVHLTTGPLSMLGSVGLIILCGMALLKMAVMRRWYAFIALVAIIAISGGGAMFASNVLNEKSMAEATAIARSFADGSAKLPTEWADDLPVNKEAVLSTTVKKAVELRLASTFKHRYDFNLHLSGQKPLVLTIYDASTQPRVWVHAE